MLASRSTDHTKRRSGASIDDGESSDAELDFGKNIDHGSKHSFQLGVESSNGTSRRSDTSLCGIETETDTKHSARSMWPDLQDHESLSGSVVDLTVRVQSPTHRALYVEQNLYETLGDNRLNDIVSIDDEVELEEEDTVNLYATPILSLRPSSGHAWESSL
jgi:hypothetical protein